MNVYNSDNALSLYCAWHPLQIVFAWLATPDTASFHEKLLLICEISFILSIYSLLCSSFHLYVALILKMNEIILSWNFKLNDSKIGTLGQENKGQTIVHR